MGTSKQKYDREHKEFNARLAKLRGESVQPRLVGTDNAKEPEKSTRIERYSSEMQDFKQKIIGDLSNAKNAQIHKNYADSD